MNTETGIRIKM